MHEATKGRFKESLWGFEKKRAADRERLKGNESFKVGVRSLSQDEGYGGLFFKQRGGPCVSSTTSNMQVT